MRGLNRRHSRVINNVVIEVLYRACKRSHANLMFALIAVILGANYLGHAQVVTSTLAVGANPQAMAVNPVTNKIYVANADSSNVTVIDGAREIVLPGPSVGAGPGA